MSLTLACPSCRKVIRTPDELAGRDSICPHCWAPFRVPPIPPLPAAGRGTVGYWAAAVVAVAVAAGGGVIAGHHLGRSKDRAEFDSAEARAADLAKQLARSDAALGDSRRANDVARSERAGLVDRLAVATRDRDEKAAAVRELDGKLKAALAVGALGNRRDADAAGLELRDLRKFQGAWQPAKFVVNGSDLGPQLRAAGTEFECKLDKLVGGAGVPSGVILLRPDKTPAEIDIKPGDNFNDGRLIEGVYKFEGDGLVLCLARARQQRPTHFEAGDGVAFIKLVRPKKDD